MITFDDGYRDNYEIALPLLRAHGLRASFFLATGFLDRPAAPWWDEIAWMVREARTPALAAGDWLDADLPLADPVAAGAALVARYKALPADRAAALLDHVAEASGAGRCPPERAAAEWMTWDMARELRDAGMWIGGHTVSHPILSAIAPVEQEAEISGCAARLAAELGQPMRWFAYPVGDHGTFDAATRSILAAQGVELAFSFYGGHQRFAHWDRLDLRRVHVGPQVDGQLLRAMLALPQVFARPARTVPG
jgi:peptidoglycan/xylan/chitin deacetylase (PgdA/CDA1 family)